MPCSTGDKLFALCDPASHGYLSKHKADLTDPKHKMRVSVGRYGKRKVSADGIMAAPTSSPQDAKADWCGQRRKWLAVGGL